MAGARGEETIKVGEREVQVLYTNRALAEVEGKLGQSIIQMLRGFQTGDSGITELMHLLRAGMEAHRQDIRAGGRAVTVNDAFAVLEEIGFARTAEPVLLAVTAVLDYGTDDGAGDSDPNA